MNLPEGSTPADMHESTSVMKLSSGADNVLVVNKAVVTTSPSVIDDWTK